MKWAFGRGESYCVLSQQIVNRAWGSIADFQESAIRPNNIILIANDALNKGEDTKMKTCPECGSTDIVPDLLVFADEVLSGYHPPYVKLVEPAPTKLPFVWMPKTVATGFRAAICGACGYTQLYTKHYAEILEAHRKGYTSQQQTVSILPPP